MYIEKDFTYRIIGKYNNNTSYLTIHSDGENITIKVLNEEQVPIDFFIAKTSNLDGLNHCLYVIEGVDIVRNDTEGTGLEYTT